MKIFKVMIILLLMQQTTFGQDRDTLVGTLKIRKPVGQYSDGILMKKNGDQPQVLNGTWLPKIPYPENAKKLNLKGPVFIGVEVDGNGKATRAWLVRGVHPVLDEAALNYVKTWGFGRKWFITNTQFSLPINFY